MIGFVDEIGGAFDGPSEPQLSLSRTRGSPVFRSHWREGLMTGEDVPYAD